MQKNALARTISRPAHPLDHLAPYFDSKDIQQAYEDGATEALASQWVSVKERLPEEGQEVLLYDVNSIRHYVIGWRRKKGDNKSMWTLSNGFVADKDITHWIPIPPLKGGDE